MRTPGAGEPNTKASSTEGEANQPPALGARDENPTDIRLRELLAEDFRTHDSSLLEPGFWVMLTHRIGNRRMRIRTKVLRAPITLLWKTAYIWCQWAWGIKLCYTVKVGRRVRIWHNGGMILGARSIGNDVHIRQNTTFGVSRRDRPTDKPVIGDNVDIGAGAVIVGPIKVGDNSIIAANSLVNRDVPSDSIAIGVPAAIRPRRTSGETGDTEPARHATS